LADDLEDLDEAVRRHDPDRWLATRFISDAQARADVIALYAFNHEITRVPGAVSDPMMGEIRLTWWAEALSEIYEDRTVRRHPVTLALVDAIRRHDLPRAPFETLIEARYPELYKEPVDAEAAEVPLMTLAARVLGAPSSPAFAAAMPPLIPRQLITVAFGARPPSRKACSCRPSVLRPSRTGLPACAPWPPRRMIRAH